MFCRSWRPSRVMRFRQRLGIGGIAGARKFEQVDPKPGSPHQRNLGQLDQRDGAVWRRPSLSLALVNPCRASPTNRWPTSPPPSRTRAGSVTATVIFAEHVSSFEWCRERLMSRWTLFGPMTVVGLEPARPPCQGDELPPSHCPGWWARNALHHWKARPVLDDRLEFAQQGVNDRPARWPA